MAVLRIGEDQLGLVFPHTAPRYDIVCPRNHENMRDSVLLHRNLTRREVIRLRELSGDIVVHSGTTRVVTETWWLWQWEKDIMRTGTRPSFAQQAIRWQTKRGL